MRHGSAATKEANLSAGVEISFVTVCGHRLEVQRIAGAKVGAPTIVFLHEGLGSVAMWRDFPQRVVEATGCHAVVYSRYGYGQSDLLQASFAVRYMHDEGLAALPELLEKLGIEEPILFGHSDGGSISLVHAGAHDRVKALVLEAPHVFVEDVCVESIAAAKITFATTDLAKKLGRYHADPEKSFRGWNDVWLHPDFRAWNIEDCLPRITCPVLAIQGEDDEYGTMEQLHRIGRAIPDAELVDLADCRHSPHKDQPAAVIEAMTRFVDRITG
jgi:pimeloyl-ACP methyl ester carboxylesterase